jgi:hypothetical protein
VPPPKPSHIESGLDIRMAIQKVGIQRVLEIPLRRLSSRRINQNAKGKKSNKTRYAMRMDH